MSLKFTILGCGSSMGVPRVALGWGSCDPNNPRNRRLRCSLLVERSGPAGITRVLVDCTPDLRAQLQQLDGRVERVAHVGVDEHAGRVDIGAPVERAWEQQRGRLQADAGKRLRHPAEERRCVLCEPIPRLGGGLYLAQGATLHTDHTLIVGNSASTQGRNIYQAN